MNRGGRAGNSVAIKNTEHHSPSEEHEEEPRAGNSNHEYRVFRMPITSKTTWNAREYEQVADQEYELGGLVTL